MVELRERVGLVVAVLKERVAGVKKRTTSLTSNAD